MIPIATAIAAAIVGAVLAGTFSMVATALVVLSGFRGETIKAVLELGQGQAATIATLRADLDRQGRECTAEQDRLQGEIVKLQGQVEAYRAALIGVAEETAPKPPAL